MADESAGIIDVEFRRWVHPLMVVARRLKVTRLGLAIVRRWGFRFSADE